MRIGVLALQGDFALQVGGALRQLLRLRDMAVRRAAFHHVAQVGPSGPRPAAAGAHGLEHVVQQDPRLVRKGLAQAVFRFVGRVAHHHPVGLHHDLGQWEGGVFAPGAQAAGLALGRGIGQLRPVHPGHRLHARRVGG